MGNGDDACNDDDDWCSDDEGNDDDEKGDDQKANMTKAMMMMSDGQWRLGNDDDDVCMIWKAC